MFFSKKPFDKNNIETSFNNSPGDQNTENIRMLSTIAKDYLKEKRLRRRWGYFFRSIVLIYIGFSSYYYFNIGTLFGLRQPHTALIELDGTIGTDGISANQLNEKLRKAFHSKFSDAVILNINSPGGSPVHSAQINEEIIRLKSLYPDKPLYVTISDICTSGGYYIAVAADQIYAHPSSMVGSIGVLMNGFGFVESMKKLGIQRRLITSGKNKGILDPFSPLDLNKEKYIESILNVVHQEFIAAVKRGRNGRLQEDYPDLFSGLFWSGKQAERIGLIDGFGSAETVAREIIGNDHVVNYTLNPSLLKQLAEEISIKVTSIFGMQFPILK